MSPNSFLGIVLQASDSEWVNIYKETVLKLHILP